MRKPQALAYSLAPTLWEQLLIQTIHSRTSKTAMVVEGSTLLTSVNELHDILETCCCTTRVTNMATVSHILVLC